MKKEGGEWGQFLKTFIVKLSSLDRVGVGVRPHFSLELDQQKLCFDFKQVVHMYFFKLTKDVIDFYDKSCDYAIVF